MRDAGKRLARTRGGAVRSCVNRRLSRLSKLASLTLGAAYLLSASPATAQTSTNYGEARIEFEGGDVGKDMADVISAFSKSDGVLAAREHFPAETTGLCPILEAELKVPGAFCTEALRNALLELNAKSDNAIDVNAINPKTGVWLPVLDVQKTESEQLFDLSVPEQEDRLKNIEKNKGWEGLIDQSKSKDDIYGSLTSKAGSNPPRINSRTITKYIWSFPLASQDTFYKALEAAEAKELADDKKNNVIINIERNESDPKQADTAASDFYTQWCDPPGAVAGEGSFTEMVDSFYSTEGVSPCEDGSLVPGEKDLAIADQPISPNYDIDIPPPDPVDPLRKECSRGTTYDEHKDHGMLLTTVIASQPNGWGFAGVAPKARLDRFDWVGKVKNSELKDFIEQSQSTTPAILFASNFTPTDEKPETGPRIPLANRLWKWDETKYLDELLDEHLRFENTFAGPIVIKILEGRSLIIASAGQADNSTGRTINAETPRSPQNLGDTPKVLVVGACSECKGEQATIWTNSNRGADFVGVLAPGGLPVPTYLPDNKVQTTPGGTSAAAAFAGVAANMHQCYPSKYKNAQKLKERLVLASYPTVADDSRSLVSGGVVDPSVSMLDPDKDWRKLGNNPVAPVEFEGWCDQYLRADEDGNEKPFELREVRRLSKLTTGELVARSTEEEIKGSHTLIRFETTRPRKLISTTPSTRVARVKMPSGAQTSCAVTVEDLTDLFLKKDYETLVDPNQAGQSCDPLDPCQ
jgi:hypothetical protein